MGKVNIRLQEGIYDQENTLQAAKLNENEDSSPLIEKETSAKKSDSKDTGQKDKATRNTKSNSKTSMNKIDVNGIKKRKQVFSFRADLADIAVWKAYATATGCTMETIGTKALNEYLSRHKLKGADLDIFEAMKSKIVNK